MTMPSRTTLLLLLGVVATALYAAIVDIAAELTPGYSHVAQPVSSLYQSGAPLRLPVAAVTVVSVVLARTAMRDQDVARAGRRREQVSERPARS
jgi:hypothetical protein